VAGQQLAKTEVDRRAGDPPSLVAEAIRIREALNWTPKFDDLEAICSSSLNWERKLVQSKWQN
jgi:UDP-glucose 4-epimerase